MKERTKKAKEKSLKEKAYKRTYKEKNTKKEKQAKRLEEQGAKAEKKQKEKIKKKQKEQAKKAERVKKEKLKKEKRMKEKSGKGERKIKEKKMKEEKAKEKAKKAERTTKEAKQKYKGAQKVLIAIDQSCKAKAKLKTKHFKEVTVTSNLVKSLTKTKLEMCAAEKKAQEKAKKSKAKLLQTRKHAKIAGPGFQFGKNPCKEGSNTFTQKLVLNQRVNVGIIPAGKVNVKIELNTDKDVDTELWTPNGENAIVAWQCKSHQKKHMKSKCIDSAQAVKAKFRDITISYSGYMPKNGQFGKEYIHIIGQSKYAFLIRAYAYQAGTAKVKYSWDKDKKLCAEVTKEKSTKSAIKKQLENQKQLSNENISQALKSSRSCKAAGMILKKTKAKMSAAKKKYAKLDHEFKTCQARKKAQMAKMKKMKSHRL